ncbi:RES domain-containing protein [Paroceanicella profunda]|uniref:RES domain-containing protein n=1 Tax=Paroceanicella profunda TaxID=2579971 RepID=A0A5B8FV76_9RHOB|nr:RES family NAD+ phosphorylase [Paroceanicella profunda]QDL92315.1 RES domain-containing protein [Paroceanicella profunda]
MSLPPVTALRQLDTCRLIPSRYSDGGDSVLTRIADDDAHLQDIFALDGATNDRLEAEANLLPGIGIGELIFGVPHYRIVNAAFCHASPLGSRFNGPERGAWYAGFEVETSLAEIIWHRTVALAEIDHFEDEVTYDGYLADFGAAFHDLRGAEAFRACLDPQSYRAAQALASELLEAGAAGIVYPSVRAPGGTCLACFRPALVGHVRKAARYRIAWSGSPDPDVSLQETC